MIGSVVKSLHDVFPCMHAYICAGISSVFSKIGCDSGAIMELLGGHAGVTDTTVLQYLGIVEQRTNELLQLQAFLQAQVGDCARVPAGVWPRACPAPPSTTSYT